MQDNITILKGDAIKDSAITLNLVNYQIAELVRIKEELEARLSALLEHGPSDGQRTYTAEKYSITVKTGYNYSIDKEEYLIAKSHIQPCFNPVKEVTKLELDKSILRDVEKFGSKEDIKLTYSFITAKSAKLHIKIGSATR